jgi:methionine synthase I (cobalamin-dependent)
MRVDLGSCAATRCPEEANLRSPESVVSVHVGYIRAGAELTKRIRSAPIASSRPFSRGRLQKINSTAAVSRAKREVTGGEIFIAARWTTR